jgi:hypothetical protein
MNELQLLQEWYASMCDGDWEHQNGVKMKTLDNPGWTLQVDIMETQLAHKEFKPVEIDRTPDDWIACRVEDGVFKAAGGPRNLPEMISVFLEWATLAARS